MKNFSHDEMMDAIHEASQNADIVCVQEMICGSPLADRLLYVFKCLGYGAVYNYDKMVDFDAMIWYTAMPDYKEMMTETLRLGNITFYKYGKFRVVGDPEYVDLVPPYIHGGLGSKHHKWEFRAATLEKDDKAVVNVTKTEYYKFPSRYAVLACFESTCERKNRIVITNLHLSGGRFEEQLMMLTPTLREDQVKIAVKATSSMMAYHDVENHIILGDFNGGRMDVDPMFFKSMILPSVTPFEVDRVLYDPEGMTNTELFEMWDAVMGSVYKDYMVSFMDVLKMSSVQCQTPDKTPPITNQAGLEIDLVWANPEIANNGYLRILATCEMSKFTKVVDTTPRIESFDRFKEMLPGGATGITDHHSVGFIFDFMM